jgi:hypothetical protein
MFRTLPGIATATLLVLAGCANSSSMKTQDPLEGMEQVIPATAETPETASHPNYPSDQVERGRYMTDLLGCGSCHTDGALIGEPNPDRLMAGSGVGIAISNPVQVKQPGIVFPSNLTPDPETGLGKWSLQEVIAMIQTGKNRHGNPTLPVMPWTTYAKLLPQDVEAMAMYLKSLPPVRHEVPENVRPGRPSALPYVHFGVYRSQ